MRIDLNQAAASQIANETSPKQVNAENATSTQQSLNALVSTAMSSPEIRQERVDSLKQAIDNGTYELDPEKIASSMIDEQA